MVRLQNDESRVPPIEADASKFHVVEGAVLRELWQLQRLQAKSWWLGGQAPTWHGHNVFSPRENDLWIRILQTG